MAKEKDKIFGNTFSKSIVELKLAANRLAEGKGFGSGGFTMKYQLLYLIDSFGKTSPQELIYELNMAKSNLALIAKKMIKDGLIISEKEEGNRKQIYYSITEKGKNQLKTKMQAIDNLYSSDTEMLKYLTKTVETLKKLK